LHAFKAVEETTGADHELWSFVPPAVLPRIQSNYPAGNQILLDGTPVVGEVVWDRAPGDTDVGAATPPGAKWHTTLVAGLGQLGGYYALNVTDVDCDAATNFASITGECATAYQSPGEGVKDDVAAVAAYDNSAKKGPHFLWQLTDIPQASTTDPAMVVR